MLVDSGESYIHDYNNFWYDRYVKCNRWKFVNESEDDDLKNNFVGVLSSNQIFHFTNFHKLINEKNVWYPFMIMNTDRDS